MPQGVSSIPGLGRQRPEEHFEFKATPRTAKAKHLNKQTMNE